MKQILKVAIVALAVASAASAHAVEITYDSITPDDHSGKTSVLAGYANTSSTNVFVETFDRAGGGGGITMSSSLVTVSTLSGGSLGFAQGNSSGYYAAPAGDSTYFAYGPSANSNSNSSSVKFDYAGLLATLGEGASLNYFGLYYGSIDTYNDVTFYNAAGSVIQTITGGELISRFGGISGNTSADSSNIYVNLLFTVEEEFSAFSFHTTSRAFEIDNLVVGYQIASLPPSPPGDVPEPASLALLGLGLIGFGVARRRNKL